MRCRFWKELPAAQPPPQQRVRALGAALRRRLLQHVRCPALRHCVATRRCCADHGLWVADCVTNLHAYQPLLHGLSCALPAACGAAIAAPLPLPCKGTLPLHSVAHSPTLAPCKQTAACPRRYWTDVENPRGECPKYDDKKKGICYRTANRANKFMTHGALIGGPKWEYDAGALAQLCLCARPCARGRIAR